MRVLNALAGIMLAAAALLGHHSTAPYDLIHGTIIEGAVTRFDWENPHAHISLDVTGEENATEHWRIELGNPGQLRRLAQPSQLRRFFGRSRRIRVDKALANNKHFQMSL